MQPKISVVIPYYQREPGILRKAIVSAIRQTGVGPMEIIVVDDNSSDNTGQICRRFQDEFGDKIGRGVYVYKIEVRDFSQKHHDYIGHVTLLASND